MIKYVIQAKKNPLKKNEVKYYPQAAPTTPVTLAQIIKRIEKRSTVSSADVKAVLDALQYEVVDALENGNTVRLGDIGSFRLTIKAEGAATAAEAKIKGAKLIKKVNVQFTKSTVMRDSFDIRTLDFAPQEDITNAKDHGGSIVTP
ncbi:MULTISPECIES: HU family DNA-binding protein [unclassified Bacteroides]|uniref:HU family DNA-binding protein n=1 Tax=unclassified Bacteroides TaxID=2646097 RepID=UPI004063E9E7